jgi:small-conductance mechanosensitive channel
MAMTVLQANELRGLSAGIGRSILASAPTSEGGILTTVIEVVVTIAAIAVFGTLLSKGVARISKKAGASKGVANSVRQWIAVLMIMLGIAAVTGLTGISSQFTTLTLSGIGGLALSLALQNTLSNVIAGVSMLQDGLLRLGDEIEFGTVRGEVVKLSLRTTWIKTNEGVISVIGNSNLAAGPIINRTAKARLERKLEL